MSMCRFSFIYIHPCMFCELHDPEINNSGLGIFFKESIKKKKKTLTLTSPSLHHIFFKFLEIMFSVFKKS